MKTKVPNRSGSGQTLCKRAEDTYHPLGSDKDLHVLVFSRFYFAASACFEKREVTTSEQRKSSVLDAPSGQLPDSAVVCI